MKRPPGTGSPDPESSAQTHLPAGAPTPRLSSRQVLAAQREGPASFLQQSFSFFGSSFLGTALPPPPSPH